MIFAYSSIEVSCFSLKEFRSGEALIGVGSVLSVIVSASEFVVFEFSFCCLAQGASLFSGEVLGDWAYCTFALFVLSSLPLLFVFKAFGVVFSWSGAEKGFVLA